MRSQSMRSMTGRWARIVSVTMVGFATLVAVGIAPWMWRHAEPAAAVLTVDTSAPSLAVMVPPRAPRATDLVLPGSIQAIQETAIYARVDGYLKRRLVNIGDRVQTGQVLAEIDTPELDQQLSQARATLAQAEASLAQARASLQQARATLQHNQAQLAYNRTTLSRWRTLKDKELVAQQDVDDRQVLADSSQADVEAAQANVDALQASVVAADANVTANQANVQRLLDTQSFQKVRAPFPGIVTVRNVDNGALISSGSSSGNTPLFRMAQIDSLRVYVNVPQTFLTAITPGLGAQLVVREFPQHVFSAQVASTAGALDPGSRTLLTEVRMPNEGGLLRPGMYTDVKFHLTRPDPPLVIPSTALIIRSGPPRVATVGSDNKVRLQPVQLGRDYGTTVEVVQGLSEQDRLVVAPPDALQEGTVVSPVTLPSNSGAGAS